MAIWVSSAEKSLGSALSDAVLAALIPTVFLEARLPPCFLRARGLVVKGLVVVVGGGGGRWGGRAVGRLGELGPPV